MTRTILPLLAFAQTLAGCGGSPASPSRVAAQANALAIFMDRETGFSTTEVRDVHEQIVQFNTAGELIWTAVEARFPGYLADGQVITADPICTDCYFLVRFGTRDGVRRAYLTWSGEETADRPATVLDVEMLGGRLTVSDTNVTIPK